MASLAFSEPSHDVGKEGLTNGQGQALHASFGSKDYPPHNPSALLAHPLLAECTPVDHLLVTGPVTH